MDLQNGSVNKNEKGSPITDSQYQNDHHIDAHDNTKPIYKISGDLEPDSLPCYNDAKGISSWSPPKTTRPAYVSSMSVQERAKLLAGNITIEPLLFLFFVSLALGLVTTQSLVMRKFCLLELKLSDAICRNLTHYEDEEEKAQAMTSTLNMYKTLLESLPAVLLSVFIGSWSDKFGRKLVLLMPCIGLSLYLALLVVYAYYEEEMEPRYLLVTVIPLALCGGIMPIIMGAAAYISDTSTTESRIIRLAIMQAFLMSGLPVGTILGGALFSNFGYITVYCVAVVLSSLCVLYVIFYLKETIKKPEEHLNPCKELFNLTHAREGLNTCFRKRENNHRTHLLLLILALTINFFPTMGEHSVAYLYTRRKFSWTEIVYSYYSAGSLVSSMFGLLIVLPIFKMLLKIPDIAIAMVGAACKMCSESMIAFAPEGWLLFVACPFMVFGGMYAPILRGMTSHIVSREEQGKLYSVLGASEAAMPIVGAIIYTNVYKATLDTFPGAVFLMSASFFTIPTGIFLWIRHDINKRINVSPANAITDGEIPMEPQEEKK